MEIPESNPGQPNLPAPAEGQGIQKPEKPSEPLKPEGVNLSNLGDRALSPEARSSIEYDEDALYRKIGSDSLNEIRQYLIPSTPRRVNQMRSIGPKLRDNVYHKVYISELTKSIRATTSIGELHNLASLASDPHQESIGADTVKRSPEYNSVRKAVAEKLLELGLLKDSNHSDDLSFWHSSGLRYIFRTFHPNPFKTTTYTDHEKRGWGPFKFEKPVERSVEVLRPYSELIAEMLILPKTEVQS